MVVREIVVVKKPRDDKIQDKPISFPPLQNLHLILMENKKKLKKGLPLVQIKKPMNKEPLKVENYSADVMAGKTPARIKQKSDLKGSKGSEKGSEKSSGKGLGKSSENPKGSGKPDSPKESDTSKVKTSSSKDKKEKSKKKKSAIADEAIEDEEVDEEAGADAEVEEAEGDAEDEIEIDMNEDEDMEAELGEDQDAHKGDQQSKGDSPKSEEAQSPPGPDGSGGDAEPEDEYAHLSPEEREAHEKEEYIWRFKIMKKKYRNKDIPVFNEHDDLEMMKLTYQRKLREIALDENVDSYRTYLQMGFHGIEFVFTSFLGIDMVGFAQSQIDAMDQYDSLLVELGEKSRTRWFSSLPVEIRLIGFILIQAGLFYLTKHAGGLAGVMGAMMGQKVDANPNQNASSNEREEPPKRKMRGPSVKVEDLKKNVQKED